jgi:hypothetical protein
VKAEHVLLACLVVFLVTSIASMVSSIAFILRLKRYDQDVWLSLESPMSAYGTVRRLRQSASVLQFLRNKSHHSLRDEKSVKLGELMVLTNRIFLGVIAMVCAITGYVVLFVQP